MGKKSVDGEDVFVNDEDMFEGLMKFVSLDEMKSLMNDMVNEIRMRHGKG